ncbi:MAG: phosphoglycerate mutase family protein [Chitinivibrionales bacterium]|nr:phosphoglycerate mutase family protein [Chitinivibrionales bacterium]MBD3356857.1 phosphoglycerate mutase family protein [Chitinivibrionales bacterium]
MDEVMHLSRSMGEEAHRVIESVGIVKAWEDIGATVNIVGSLKTGLMANKRDIDMHVYTDPFDLLQSFSAVSRIAQNKEIKRITYTNLLDADDGCVEWHAMYDNGHGASWQIDMINILKDSPFAGYFEEVAERISNALTAETRRAILEIKYSIPAEQGVRGIEVYKAVIQDGVRDLGSFNAWRRNNPREEIVMWMPGE